jgi:hypothetical protein
VTRLRVGLLRNLDSIPSSGRKSSAPPQWPDCLCGTLTLLPNGYSWQFSRGQSGERMRHQSPPSSVVVKTAWSYPSTTPFVFVASYLINHRNRFILTLLMTFLYVLTKDHIIRLLSTIPQRPRMTIFMHITKLWIQNQIRNITDDKEKQIIRSSFAEVHFTQ